MHSATIKAARAGLDWTQKDLADAAGIHAKAVAYWERMPGDLPETPNGAIRSMKEALARHGVTIEGNAVHFHMVANR